MLHLVLYLCSYLSDQKEEYVNRSVQVCGHIKWASKRCKNACKKDNRKNWLTYLSLNTHSCNEHKNTVPSAIEILGNTSFKKECFLLGIAQITSPPPPISGNLYIFFGRQKWIYKVYFLIRAGSSPPPHSGNARKKTFFSYGGVPYYVSKFQNMFVQWSW